MMMPSIALPTGRYDLHRSTARMELYASRLARLRAALRAVGVTHAVIHGNEFDHGGLAWLTHFTPKLGPAYALIPLDGPVRLHFAGGPGMKPSAQLLTWVEDVSAIKGIGADVARWLEETAAGVPIRLGLYEGTSMRRRDWAAVVAAGAIVPLDVVVDDLRRDKSEAAGDVFGAAACLWHAADTLAANLEEGKSLRLAALDAELDAYGCGAQDVRMRIGRRPWGAPVALPDVDLKPQGPLRIVVAAREYGHWVHGCLVAGDIGADVGARVTALLNAALAASRAGARPADLVAVADGARITCRGVGLSPHERPSFDDPDAVLASGDVISIAVELEAVPGCFGVWSVLGTVGTGGMRRLWSPPGLDVAR